MKQRIELPQYTKERLAKKRKRHKVKYCEYDGCGREFKAVWGVQKYCEQHSDPRSRKDKRSAQRREEMIAQKKRHKELNCTIKISGGETHNVIKVCELEGCNRPFELKISPRNSTYPKFCEEHRSEYRREFFLRQRKLAA